MLISALYSTIASAASSKKFGEVWKPRSGMYMVGRDVNALTQTSPVLSPNRDLAVAKGEDTSFTSNQIFSSARAFAANGGRVKNFRAVDVEKLEKGSASSSGYLYEKNGKYVSYSDGSLQVYAKDEKGKLELVASCRVTDDTRLSWDADGKPVFHTGAQACSSDGSLTAEGSDEILVRVSGRDVRAGSGTTVLNLSGKKGVFSGGGNVTYLGSYGEGSVIKGGLGRTEYAGYFNGAALAEAQGAGDYSGVFENLTIDAADSANSFSGYFRAATLNGGKDTDLFSGMFLSGTALNGGKGDDTFSGRFINSVLDGGEGGDIFGVGTNLKTPATVLTESGEKYSGLESDFVDSAINGGAGDDRFDAPMWGGSLELGEGDDESRGLYSHAFVRAGEGNDRLSALYADSSVFESGAGENSVELATARASSVTTGEGKNKVFLGRNTGTAEQDFGATVGGDPAMGATTFSSPEEYKTGKAGIRFGELSGNLVHAEQGENIVSVYNGFGQQSVLTGWSKDGRDDERAETTNELSETSSPAQARRALERYALLLGQGPERKGGTGATVMTGAGENLEMGVEYRPRHEIDDNPATIRQYRRRYNGYSNSMLGARYFGGRL